MKSNLGKQYAVPIISTTCTTTNFVLYVIEDDLPNSFRAMTNELRKILQKICEMSQEYLEQIDEEENEP